MKVLLVHDYATLRGGAELSIVGLRDGLRKRGHDARFFASSAGTGDGGVADVRCFGTTSPLRTLVQTANPAAFLRLRGVLQRFQPDVVHVEMFLTQLSPLILPLLKNVPSLYHVVWYRPICPIGTKLLPNGTICDVAPGPACYRNGCLPLRDWPPLMLQMRLWRRWRSAFDLIVANSQAVKRRLEADGIRPVDVVVHGVPIRPPRPRLSSPPTVAFAGRLVPEKGADLLLRAFSEVLAEMPEAQMLLAGEGPERARLQALIAQIGLARNVVLLGHLPRAHLEDAFDGAWVQAVPSRWEEPFGIVAAEAMMRGTAVVATDSGGLREIVNHGRTGLLVTPGDVNALAKALLRLLGDREMAEAMGCAGREIAVARFSDERYVDTFLGLYEALRWRGREPHVS